MMEKYILVLFIILAACLGNEIKEEILVPFPNSQFVEDALGNRFIFPKGDSIIGFQLYHFGQWEKPYLDVAVKLMNIKLASTPTTQRSVTILDVGANFGTWTVPLAKAVSSVGRLVYAFEAQREMVAFLNTNLLINNIDNAFILHAIVSNSSVPLQSQTMSEIGAWEKIGSVPTDSPYGWRINGGINFGSYSVSNLMLGEKLGGKAYHVPKFTLDQLLKLQVIDCPLFIKLDVEFHELQVLIGARELLEKCRPIILFEADCNLLMRSIQTYLHHLDYRLAWLGVIQLDLELSYQGQTPNIELLSDLKDGSHFLFDSNNIVAIPKDEADQVLKQLPPFTLIPIEVEAGRHFIDDYNIKACLPGHWCYTKTGKLFNQTHCTEHDPVDPFLTEFYKKFS